MNRTGVFVTVSVANRRPQICPVYPQLTNMFIRFLYGLFTVLLRSAMNSYGYVWFGPDIYISMTILIGVYYGYATISYGYATIQYDVPMVIYDYIRLLYDYATFVLHLSSMCPDREHLAERTSTTTKA